MTQAARSGMPAQFRGAPPTLAFDFAISNAPLAQPKVIKGVLVEFMMAVGAC